MNSDYDRVCELILQIKCLSREMLMLVLLLETVYSGIPRPHQRSVQCHAGYGSHCVCLCLTNCLSLAWHGGRKLDESETPKGAQVLSNRAKGSPNRNAVSRPHLDQKMSRAEGRT